MVLANPNISERTFKPGGGVQTDLDLLWQSHMNTPCYKLSLLTHWLMKTSKVRHFLKKSVSSLGGG